MTLKSLQKPSVWVPLLGYTLLAGWTLVFITGVAWLYADDANGKAIVDLRIFMILGFTGCVLLLSGLGKIRKNRKASVLGVVGSLFMCAGFLITVVSMPSLLESEYIHYAGSCCAGIGLGLVFASSENFWKQFEPRMLAFLCSSSSIVAILVNFVINSCPQSVAIVLSVSIPCMAALVFSGFFFKNIYSGAFEFESANFYQNQADIDYSPDRAAMQIGVVFFLVAVSVFCQQSYYLNALLPLNIYSCFAISFVVLIAFLATFIALMIKPINKAFSFKAIYGMSAVVLLGVSVVSFAGVDHLVVTGVCFSLSMMVLIFCGIVLQISCLQSSSNYRTGVLRCLMAALFIASFFLAIPYTAVSVGEYLLSTSGETTVAFVTCFAIFVVALVSKGTLTAFEGPRLFAQETVSQDVVFDWALACKLLAGQKGLSEREEEVLLLIAQGFKNKNISEKLFISDNTVRAHIRNIYKKIEVHSKADVMKKLEETIQK